MLDVAISVFFCARCSFLSNFRALEEIVLEMTAQQVLEQLNLRQFRADTGTRRPAWTVVGLPIRIRQRRRICRRFTPFSPFMNTGRWSTCTHRDFKQVSNLLAIRRRSDRVTTRRPRLWDRRIARKTVFARSTFLKW